MSITRVAASQIKPSKDERMDIPPARLESFSLLA
jgi:hypothetical protein